MFIFFLDIIILLLFTLVLVITIHVLLDKRGVILKLA